MKKLLVTMLTILTSGAAFALPVGNPSDASLLCDGICWEGHCGDMCDPCLTWCDAFSIRFGFYGDYVYERHLQVDHNLTDKKPHIDHSRIMTNAAFFAGNFWDRFDVFATVGATRWYLEGNLRSFQTTTAITPVEFQVESETNFSWSVGARGTIWECGCLAVGAEFQYFQTRPHIWRTLDANPASTTGTLLYPSRSIGSKYYEWQFGLGVSYRINFLVPYAAVKWSSAHLELGDATGVFVHDTTAQLFPLKSAKTWGYAVGVSLVDCEKMSLTVEGRFADETALYVNGQIRF